MAQGEDMAAEKNVKQRQKLFKLYAKNMSRYK